MKVSVIPTPDNSLGFSICSSWRKKVALATVVCWSVLTSLTSDFSLSSPLFSSRQQSSRLPLWWLPAKLTGESTYKVQINYYHKNRNLWGEEKDNHNYHILSQRLTMILYKTAEYFLNKRTVFRSDTEFCFLDTTLILKLVIPQTARFGIAMLGNDSKGLCHFCCSRGYKQPVKSLCVQLPHPLPDTVGALHQIASQSLAHTIDVFL